MWPNPQCPAENFIFWKLFLHLPPDNEIVCNNDGLKGFSFISCFDIAIPIMKQLYPLYVIRLNSSQLFNAVP